MKSWIMGNTWSWGAWGGGGGGEGIASNDNPAQNHTSYIYFLVLNSQGNEQNTILLYSVSG